MAVKTGQGRAGPLPGRVAAVLRAAIGTRAGGPVILRERLDGGKPLVESSRRELARASRDRRAAEGRALTRV